MGEFGFITADGIYHVTVYATDENGSFKILSMRNIRISGRKYPQKFKNNSVKTEFIIVTYRNISVKGFVIFIYVGNRLFFIRTPYIS